MSRCICIWLHVCHNFLLLNHHCILKNNSITFHFFQVAYTLTFTRALTALPKANQLFQPAICHVGFGISMALKFPLSWTIIGITSAKYANKSIFQQF